MEETRSNHELDELGPLLERAIKHRGLTYPEAADRLDCTDRHLRRVRNGEYPLAAARYLEQLGWDVTLQAHIDAP